MIYALRKLIAFVFLGGMFWFIFQDLDNLDKPWFMHALGLITIAFAFFWLLIPMIVVWIRRRRRVRNNRERYAKWLAEGGVKTVKPRPAGAGKMSAIASVGRDDTVLFHEKGTLYVDLRSSAAGLAGGLERPTGRPSDVAFPRFRRRCRIDQRTHCYFTDKGVAFVGKGLDYGIPFAELKSFFVEPGGIVFETGGACAAHLAFTFQNPLMSADVLRFAKEGK